ncbi:hypothetical protein GIB67_006804 [Kingdonia uniflora]|uniref:Uncharacterized protein n=1 Tax=Kingdonia uniflora TaxID=39325 RepID=A0A7J7L026_9MAGN|nr:hypothetical protein GIB67_006804 [Kingdonia uniflora]
MIKSISLASSCVVNLNEKLNLLVHTVILRIALGRVIALFIGLQQKRDKNFNELDALLQQAVDEHSDPDRQTGEYDDIVDVLLRLEKE